MNLDRTIAPEIQNISAIDFQSPQFFQLSNGINIFSFDDSDQPVIRIELVFEAGAKYQSNKRIPVIVNKLLTEGTSSHSSNELSTIIDFCGASLTTETTNDFATLSLTVLHKHLGMMIPVLAEIIQDPIFPQHELELYLLKKEQELLIDSQKVSNVARDKFPSLLFGENHVYGRPPLIEDYKAVSRQMIIDFYNIFYQKSLFDIYISGAIPKNLFILLEEYFGKIKLTLTPKIKIDPFMPSKEKLHQIEFPDAVQNALRLGRLWPSRLHADFVGLQVLVTLFGGYFGSRLMTNIREDKGYTYGIGAGVRNNLEASYLFIGTEVKAENYKDVMFEIEKEMQILQNDLISNDELMIVKSVMQGAFQRSFDGSFARIDRFKELRMNGLNENYYQRFVEQLITINPEMIRNLARVYFSKEDYYKLIVGKF